MFNLNLAYDFPIEEVSKISDERKTQFILDILIGQGNSKLTYKDVEAEAKKYFYKFKPLKKTIKDIKNRDLYVSALFVLRRAIRQDLYLTRDDLVRRITIALENKIKEANLDEEELIDAEDLENITSKAYFVIRKLRDYGWINIDFNAKNSFEEYIAVPAYASMAINFLYALSEGAETEYNSMVYSVYAALKMADTESNDYYNALQSAYKSTERLNESLSNLYYGVRSIEQRISENIDLNDVVRIHFNEYIEKLHDKFYHPYKTFDSIQRYRTPIIKMLKNWQGSTMIRKKMLELGKAKKPDLNNTELFEHITELYQYILQTYENIEEKMDIIDKKIFDYTASSIDKMKHLISIDESYKGKITYLIKVLNDHKEDADDLVDIMQDYFDLSVLEYAHQEGLYTKREITITPEISLIEIVTEDKTGEDVNEIFDKIRQGYNLSKIRDFIVNKALNKKIVTMEDLNIKDDEEFILSILAMLRGDEKELPFKVEFDEGYLRIHNYLVPNIKFIMKEGRK